MTEYIDMTPSWEDLVTSLLACYESGDSNARQFARDEITRMARIADAYCEAKKEGKL